MEYREAYEAWFRQHVMGRRGEGRRRLEEGHGKAERTFLENVWWPAVGHFTNLIPEYEIRDFAAGQRFLDFAYLCGEFKACFEVDGFGPHWRDIGRRQFADQWDRQNDLILSGWKVLRFAYDSLVERPRRCQQAVLQVLGIVVTGSSGDISKESRLSPLEREIVRLMRVRGLPYITPAAVKDEFGVCVDTAYRALRNLLREQLLESTEPDRKRIHKYRLRSLK